MKPTDDEEISKMNSEENSTFNNNNNTTSVDFIEMLTLDAKEFLTIKCVCDAFSESSSFCRECFQNFKNSLNNFNNISHKNNEPIHMIRNSDAVSCEANEPNNELLLLNAKEIDIIKTNGIQKSDYKTNNCWDKKNNNEQISGEQETVSNECCKELNETNNSVECNTGGSDVNINKTTVEENNCSMEQEIINTINNDEEAPKISTKSATCEITKPSSSSLTHTNQELLCTILKAFQGSSAEDLAANLGKIVKHLEKSELQNSSAINLDPKNELNQRNSSEIFPSSSNNSSSRSRTHYQEPTYRESCASPESIDADGRFLEAPICSLKTDVDVFSVSVEHSLSQIVSKPPLSASDDCSSAGASINLFYNSSESPNNEKKLNLSENTNKDLSWSFKNGRLVFVDDDENDAKEPSTEDEVKKLTEPPVFSNEAINNNNNNTSSSTDGGKLSSKEINRRINEDGNSRLKYLEDKLKKAGITDTQTKDSITISSSEVGNKENFYKFSNPLIQQETENSKVTKYEDFKKDYYNNSAKETQDNKAQQNNNSSEGEDLIPDGSHDICQFNVKEFASFNANKSTNNPHSLGIYDEFINDDSSDGSSEDSCECDDDEDHFIVIRNSRRVREDGGHIMVNDNTMERSKHNPDRNNLKPLLKKPGRTKSKKSNRVIFNETKNEFFDADYIILIREDCELDDDDDDGICTCQQHEMVRLTCCEPNCNCQYDNGGGPIQVEQTPQSPKFAPPIEFVDAVTLSPPEGYKDMELLAAAASIRGQPRAAICRECSATHEGIEEEEEGDASQSDSEMDGQIKEQEEKEKTDQSQQTTPTTPPSIENGQNYNNMLDSLSNSARIISSDQKYLKEFVEIENNKQHSLLLPQQGSPISGILKGGRLWKQQSVEVPNNNTIKNSGDIASSDSVTSDEETGNKRSVRFIESGEKEKRVSCDGASEVSPVDEETRIIHQNEQKDQQQPMLETYNKQQELFSNSPEGSDLMLTFKLGNHVLISNNSLKPNSAVRQLFPCTKNLASAQTGVVQEEENSQQYLVTAESLRAFEEAKRAKLPQIIQSGEADETIKRAIERNTLRRSLIRYEPKSKKQPYKSDNSLIERIKMLTCDVDNSTAKTEFNKKKTNINTSDSSEDVPNSISRFSPPGEEAKNSSSDGNNTLNVGKINQDKSFSPSSSSTASSSSSASLNQNYQQMRKLSATSEQLLIMDPKRMENMPDIQNNFRRDIKPLPDIGGPHNHDLSTEPTRALPNPPDLGHCIVSNKLSSSSTNSESRRQFLSTLAPLTACVAMGVQHNEDYYYHLANHPPGERISVASSGTEYSLEDIDEGLKNEEEEQKRIAPDVLVGTPSASESGDELAMFVQQDAGRMERIKKKYQPLPEISDNIKDHQKNNDEDDDENDDYGFNRRPSVRGIKPRFSTTTEILQQIQNQLQAPTAAPPPPSTKVAWPYYSESGLTTTDNAKQKTTNSSTGNYHYVNVGEDATNRGYPPQQYRPTSLQEDNNLYQNCTNQRCLTRDVYQRSTNTNVYSSVIRMGNDYYQTLPLRQRATGRPQSPPPMEMSKQYHQTMVYIPYNHIEGYQPVQQYYPGTNNDYAVRVSSQNQINKRYVESIYQSRQQHLHHHAEDQQHYNNSNAVPPIPPKTMNRVAYSINNGPPPPSHIIGSSRSDSPQSGQFSTSARSTQTMSSCGGYYPPSNNAARFRPMVGPTSWSNSEGNYAKMNRHSFPSSMTPRYSTVDNVSLTDSDSQHSAGSIPNGFRQSDISMYASKDCIPNSPTKSRFIERGVPEGAASVSPQDISGVNQISSSSTMTSPTSPQNPVPTNQNNKPMFYAMNV